MLLNVKRATAWEIETIDQQLRRKSVLAIIRSRGHAVGD